MIQRCGSYEFAMEPMTDALVEELRPINAGFWSETEVTRRDAAPVVDYAYQQQQNALGRYIVFTVRCASALVGVFTVHIQEAARTSALIACDDALYIVPEHRVGRLALRFVQYAIDRLGSIGVTDLLFNVQMGTRSERMAEYIGMRCVSRLFHKRIGVPA